MSIGTETSWAVSQFGRDAGEVARRVVQALSDAQEVGTRTQRASGMKKRYPYGSTWSSRYDELVHQFTEAVGHERLDVKSIAVPGAPYSLVAVNGRTLVPFVLARSLADVPDQPILTSEVLRAATTASVPAPPSPAGLFELEDHGKQLVMPSPRASSDSTGSAMSTTTPAPPVFVGSVCNADTDRLLALWWGTAEAIDETGVITWSPEPLSLQLATSHDLYAVAHPDEVGERSAAFDQGDVPEITVTARLRRIPRDPEPAEPVDGEPRAAADGLDE